MLWPETKISVTFPDSRAPIYIILGRFQLDLLFVCFCWWFLFYVHLFAWGCTGPSLLSAGFLGCSEQGLLSVGLWRLLLEERGL